jgi:hypothetical protein
MWHFGKNFQYKVCFPVGKYKLDAVLDMQDILVELSEHEYAFFAKKFEAEKNYHASSVELLGFE